LWPRKFRAWEDLGAVQLRSVQVVVRLLVAVRFDGFRLIVRIEDHIRKSTIITIFAPPSRSKHRVEAMGTFARWRFALESGFEPGSRARQRR
jgi:hypothetical protein